MSIHSADWPALPSPRRTRLVEGMYFEQQVGAMCGMCAFNNATGGQHFLTDDMHQAVQDVLAEYKKVAQHHSVEYEAKEPDHWSPGGDFSEEALACALRRDGRWEFDSLSTSGRGLWAVASDDVVGAVVHKASQWSAARVVENSLWLLDSLKEAPTEVEALGSKSSAAWFGEHPLVFCLRRKSTATESVPAPSSRPSQRSRRRKQPIVSSTESENEEKFGATQARLQMHCSRVRCVLLLSAARSHVHVSSDVMFSHTSPQCRSVFRACKHRCVMVRKNESLSSTRFPPI